MFFLWIDFKEVRIRKIYCPKCEKHKKFKKHKTSYICDKTSHFLAFVTSAEVKIKK